MGGQTVSQIGSQVTILALPLVAIVVLRATTFEVGLLSVATTSAYLLVALPAGVLADRVSKRGVMLGCDLASMAVIGWVPVAQAAGPGLEALLVGLAGAARAMAGDAISFAVAATCLFLVRGRELGGASAVREQRARFGPQLRECWAARSESVPCCGSP